MAGLLAPRTKAGGGKKAEVNEDGSCGMFMTVAAEVEWG